MVSQIIDINQRNAHQALASEVESLRTERDLLKNRQSKQDSVSSPELQATVMKEVVYRVDDKIAKLRQ